MIEGAIHIFECHKKSRKTQDNVASCLTTFKVKLTIVVTYFESYLNSETGVRFPVQTTY